MRTIVGIAASAGLIAIIPSTATAQSGGIIHACYLPGSGTVYRVDEPGLKNGCNSPNHVAFEWNSQGVQGVQGPAGPTGPTGATGPAGPQGPIGLTGAKGDGGPAGPIGPKGDVGATGPTGPQGEVGATGATGAQGVSGSDGAIGPVGPKGDKGEPGRDGANGSAGPQGEPGPAGGAGPAGQPGPIGPQGPAGPTGPGFTLPYNATLSNANVLLGITNTGTGGGIFVNSNGGSTAGSAIVAQSTGNVSTLTVTNNGAGAAIFAKGSLQFQSGSPVSGIRFGDGTFQSTAAVAGPGFSLPFNGTANTAGSAFGITNTGSGPAIQASAVNNATGPAVEFTSGGSGIALELRGHLRLSPGTACSFPQTCNGIRFSDGTVQTTAAAAGGGGLTGHQVVSQTTPLSHSENQGLVVGCPSGKRALGGGITSNSMDPGAPYPQIIASSVEPSGFAWNGKAYKPVGVSQWQVTVSVICANAAP